MNRHAIFSECGKYRYQLSRVWDISLPFAMCIGLNPSNANAEKDDPTIRKLISLLKDRGYGGLYMCNLFGFISSNPKDLQTTTDPLKDNDDWLKATESKCEDVIFCWGDFKQAKYRESKIIYMFPKALCFGRTNTGCPKHPAGFVRAGIPNDKIHLESWHK